MVTLHSHRGEGADEPLLGPWYTISRVADMLMISKRTVFKLVSDGQLVAYRVGRNGHRRISKTDLEAFMEQNIDNRCGESGVGHPENVA